MNAIITSNPNNGGITAAIEQAVMSWADSTTDPTSSRRNDLLRDKCKILLDFFTWCNKPVDQVTPADVKAWQASLTRQHLEPSTVYGFTSRVSSFYNFLLGQDDMRDFIQSNPTQLARPKAPKPYGAAESAKALDDDELARLVAAVRSKGGMIGKRDYALLIFYLTTGLRRAEVAGLKWGDIKLIEGGLQVALRIKGGEYIRCQYNSPALRDAIMDYLQAGGRVDSIGPDDPLWLRHDIMGDGLQVTDHGIAKQFKGYAKAAGIRGFHLHQLRHSFARLSADISGDIFQVAAALNHRDANNTRIYVQKLGMRKDHFSDQIAKKFL